MKKKGGQSHQDEIPGEILAGNRKPEGHGQCKTLAKMGALPVRWMALAVQELGGLKRESRRLSFPGYAASC